MAQAREFIPIGQAGLSDGHKGVIRLMFTLIFTRKNLERICNTLLLVAMSDGKG
jgi:hypothetical protein